MANIRDEFEKTAMVHLMGEAVQDPSVANWSVARTMQAVATLSYKMADAMMLARAPQEKGDDE